MTTTLFAPTALLPDGWARDVRLTLDGARIAAVEPGAAPGPGDRVLAGQALLPAMPNLHSHAFQRAMAGMTERRGPGDDSFWTWRTLMYRFLDLLTPDDVEAIAALVQVEMLEAGYGSVAEFHYLHHQPGGDALRRPGRARPPHRRRRRRHRHRPHAAAGALQLRRRRRGPARRRPAPLRQRPRRLPAAARGGAAGTSPPTPCSAPRRTRSGRRRRPRSRRSPRPCPTARCTSTPPSRCRRSRRSRPGSAPGPSPSCSTASASARAGASSTPPR